MSPDGEVRPAGVRRATPSGTCGVLPSPPPSRGPRPGPRAGCSWCSASRRWPWWCCSGAQADRVFPDFRNPFAKEQTDRSQPPLLKSIQDLSRYVAAEGNFQVVVDLQNDRKNVPEFLLNERTLFVGAGSVEAYVDFAQDRRGGASSCRRTVSPSSSSSPRRSSARPTWTWSRATSSPSSEACSTGSGTWSSSDPNRQQQVYQLAEERITAAARDSGLGARAEENTRKMLEGLLRSLGYEQITVTYAAP